MIYAFAFLLLLLGGVLVQAGVSLNSIYFWIIILIVVLIMVVLEMWATQHDKKDETN